MQPITKNDLLLINDLRSRIYTGYTLTSNTTIQEQQQLIIIKNKLRDISNYFANKYNGAYGPFEVSVSSGNPITQRNTFNNVWAGLFKGATNKQYAAQVSFVMNRQDACLDVGFYFGRASGRSFADDERTILETQLRNLGTSLSDTINNDDLFHRRYDSLFDFGFKAYSRGQEVNQEEWINTIRVHTENSQIIAKIYPNDFDVIENSTIDSFVSQVIFLMGGISNVGIPAGPIIIKPLTPEQRAKQAERLSQIGQNGELYVMQYEKSRLEALGINNIEYPKHVALDSMHYGYDILSLDENHNEIFIEVKTTTRSLEDPSSKSFFLSINELNVFNNNKLKYKLYRVYDIENIPSIELLNLDKVTLNPEGYIVEY